MIEEQLPQVGGHQQLVQSAAAGVIVAIASAGDLAVLKGLPPSLVPRREQRPARVALLQHIRDACPPTVKAMSMDFQFRGDHEALLV